MKAPFCIAVCVALAGCMTLSGTYTVVARDPNTGVDLPGPRVIAEGSVIYIARNALCIRNPKAHIVITDPKTEEELKSESPYKCP